MNPCLLTPEHHRPATTGRPACARGSRRQSGFTLIELMIGIAIAAALFGAVAMGINAVTGAQAREAAGELSAGIRMMYDEAALSGRTCRIVFTLPPKNEEEGQVEWRAECSERGVTSSRNREEELEAANEAERDREGGRTSAERAADARSRRGAADYDITDAPSLDELLRAQEGEVAQATAFADFTSPLVEPTKLPPSVRLNVWTRQQREAVDEGVAYLYFFPQGYTERSMVFLTQGDNEWTIKVSPLTGKTEIIPERVEVPR